MKKYSKSCLATLIVMLMCTNYVLAEERLSIIVPEIWKPQKIADDRAYMNITGDYVLLGENAPGTPSYFMGEPE